MRVIAIVSVVLIASLTGLVVLTRPLPAGGADAKGPISSGVAGWKGAAPWASGKWGELRKYFAGETAGVRDLETGVGRLKAGEEIHKPHQHAEEEFILITRGKGKLHVAGKDYPAAEGDMFYAAPWVFHGFTNDSSEELSFFVIKWNGKNGPPPPKPEK